MTIIETFEDLQAENMALQQRVVELEQSFHTLQTIFGSISDIILVMGDDGRYLNIVPTTPDLLYQPAQDLLGRSLDEVMPAEQADLFLALIRDALRSGQKQSIEYLLPVQAGGVWFHATASPLDQERVVFVIRDITERKQVEEELRESQALLQSVLDNLPAMVYVRDREYRFVLNNHAYYATTHLSAEQMIGQRDTDLFGPEMVAEWRVQDEQIVESGQMQQFEHLYQSPDGLNALLSIKFPIYDTTGALTMLGGISLDITPQKRAEADARIFQTLAENAPDGIVVAGLDETITYVNPSFRTSMAYGNDIIGMPVASLLTTESRELLPDIVRQVQEQGTWQGVVDQQRQDGSSFPSQVSMGLITGLDGTPYGFGAIIRDITEQVEREEELRIFRTLVEHMTEGVTHSHADSTFFYANPAYRALTGQGEALVGKTIFDVYQDSPDVLRTATQMAIEHGNWQGPLTIQRLDGATVPCQVSMVTLYDNDGQPQTLLAVVRDITDQKHAEAQREALQQQVIDVQREAIRELSTPLIPITKTTVVMPLIGTLDSTRAQQVLETLLEGVAKHQASLAILDITGIHVVDTQVADALIRAAQAAKLLGAQVMLTGIRPQIAQTLVHLGVELRGIMTQSSLQSGIAYALQPSLRL